LVPANNGTQVAVLGADSRHKRPLQRRPRRSDGRVINDPIARRETGAHLEPVTEIATGLDGLELHCVAETLRNGDAVQLAAAAPPNDGRYGTGGTMARMAPRKVPPISILSNEESKAQRFDGYLADNPGAVDFWLGGHTHTHPDDTTYHPIFGFISRLMVSEFATTFRRRRSHRRPG